MNRLCGRVSSRKTAYKCPRRLGAAETRGGICNGCDFISLKKVVVHCGGPHATERSLAMMAQTQAALCSRQCMPACLHRRATMILAAASACADEM